MMMDINNLINKLPYAMQNTYGAIATVVATNVLIVELSGRIARLVSDIFHKRWNLSENAMGAVVITVMAGTMIGTNVALNKLLKFPFNLWVTAGLSSLTFISYAAVRVATMKQGKFFE
jgi:hypothetical protein